MERSKLESLPNEILLHLFEHYINGVDIVVAFNHQLNRRFTSLISQMRRISFDFDRCRKDDFRFCMGLLPAYAPKVEGLILSDASAPGQIHAFFSFYPTLEIFPRLRTFSLCYQGGGVSAAIIRGAIQSLKQTQIETLSILRKFGDNHLAPGFISDIFADSPHLKCLQLFFPRNQIIWRLDIRYELNLEHLNMISMQTDFRDFERICAGAPRLRSLRMRISSDSEHLRRHSQQLQSLTTAPMKKLHTLELAFSPLESLTFEDLGNWLQIMPALQHLTIEACPSLLCAEKWQTLLETSLPLLTEFILWISNIVFMEGLLFQEASLAPFQTAFWIDRPKFNVIVVHPNYEPFRNIDLSVPYEVDYSSYSGCYIDWLDVVPQRQGRHDPSISAHFDFLVLGAENRENNAHYRFMNVQSLIVDTYPPIVDTPIRSIDCSRIKWLGISRENMRKNELTVLFNSMKNVGAVQMVHGVLASLDLEVSCPSVRHLNLSGSEHDFGASDIVHIGRCFPSLECLKIRTEDLSDVPKLEAHCSNLTCLLFWREGNSRFMQISIALRKLRDDLRLNERILFDELPSAIRIWLDHHTFQSLSWNRYTSKESSLTSPNPSVSVTKKNSIASTISSFFRRFK